MPPKDNVNKQAEDVGGSRAGKPPRRSRGDDPVDEQRRRRRRASQAVYKQDAPTSAMGLTVEQHVDRVLAADGERMAKIEAGYREPSADAATTCGTCRFFLRHNHGVEGGCQVVDGAISWFGTSDAYISAAVEAAHVFAVDGYAMILEKVAATAAAIDDPSDHASELRARVRQPGLFKDRSFRRLRIGGGVSAIRGRLKTSGKFETQAMRFDKAQFTRAQAAKWLRDHDVELAKAGGGSDDLVDLAAAQASVVGSTMLGKMLAAGAVDALGDGDQDEATIADLLGLDEVEMQAEIVGIEKREVDGAAQRITYGVVLAPMEVDAHKDVAVDRDIEMACHHFNEYGGLIGDQHARLGIDSPVLESYICPADFTVTDVTGAEQTITKGSWVLVTRVDDDDVWGDIKAGRKTGYSFGGLGVRTQINTVDDLRAAASA